MTSNDEWGVITKLMALHFGKTTKHYGMRIALATSLYILNLRPERRPSELFLTHIILEFLTQLQNK